MSSPSLRTRWCRIGGGCHAALTPGKAATASDTHKPMTRLHELSALGQSVWIDFLSRDLLESGALARALEADAVVGVTSNPTILEQALAQGDAYDAQIRATPDG